MQCTTIHCSKLSLSMAYCDARRAMARKHLTLQVTIPRELIEWLDVQVKKRKFHHRSNGVEVALLELKQAMTSTSQD